MIEQALPIVGGLAGLTTLILGVLAYFKWKPKHPVDVKAAEVSIIAEHIKNEDQIIARYRGEIERLDKERDLMIKRLDTLEKKQQTQLESYSRQEADCAAKIGSLNRQIHKLTEKIQRAENRCVDGCFANKTP